MSTDSATNGRPQRKQLADQLDRFDAIFDGLSEGLNGAVIDAVREGTRLAVKDAIVEILTDPLLRAKLHQAAAPESAPSPASPEVKPVRQPGFFARLKRCASDAIAAVGNAASSAVAKTQKAVTVAVDVVKRPARSIKTRMKDILHVGLGAGIAMAVVSFLAPHAVSATLSGIAGGIAAMAVHTYVWTRRALSGLPFA